MKMVIDTLCLEVTRRCNMCCAHCLRGEAEDLDADIAKIPYIFDGLAKINSLVFTGGEPALNVPYIKAVVDYVIEHKISVRGCFIATNAKVYSPELVECVRQLYEAEYGDGEKCLDAAKWLRSTRSYECEEAFTIAISGDEYHEPVPVQNLMRYYKSGFFSDVKMNTGGPILDRGRGRYIPGAVDRAIDRLCIEADDDDRLRINLIYVSSTGAVVTDCDLPYTEIDSFEPGDDYYLGTIEKDARLNDLLKTVCVNSCV